MHCFSVIESLLPSVSAVDCLESLVSKMTYYVSSGSDIGLTTRGRRFASWSWHCLVIYFWDRWPSLAGKLSWEL